MNEILITGGTGSFGRALVKKLVSIEEWKDQNYCRRIIVYSRDEHKQEQMQREIGDDYRVRYFIGDVRDKDRLQMAMRGCDIVIHAAAMKIVPTAEYNPMECIKTNVMGAQNVIDAAFNAGVERVLALSTDKAVAPKNLYGASKLCAEKLFLASNTSLASTKFSIVRYGNVANSNGSVIPIFLEQRAKGLPLTVTDERMTRYWITINQAVEFVLACLYNMNGGEVFIPPMPSFKVMVLAYILANKGVKFTGIRPGEKLHEQIDDNKSSDTNDHWLDEAELTNELKSMGLL